MNCQILIYLYDLEVLKFCFIHMHIYISHDELLVVVSYYILFNSLVITGFYRPGEFSIFLYGVLVGLKHKAELNPINIKDVH